MSKMSEYIIVNSVSDEYPRPLYNMEKNLNVLLRYHDYPESIRRSIHSTNLIERMNKENQDH